MEKNILRNTVSWCFIGTMCLFQIVKPGKTINILFILLVTSIGIQILCKELNYSDRDFVIGLLPATMVGSIHLINTKAYSYFVWIPLVVVGVIILINVKTEKTLFRQIRDPTLCLQIFYKLFKIYLISFLICFGINTFVRTLSVVVQASTIDTKNITEEQLKEQLFRYKNYDLALSTKIEIINHIINYESSEVGLPFQINVYAAELGERQRGVFQPIISDSIFLQKNFLEDSTLEDTIFVALHEFHHLYMYYISQNFSDSELLKLQYFSDLNNWKSNAENYISDDYQQYNEQFIEKSADRYAKEQAEFYLELLNNSE